MRRQFVHLCVDPAHALCVGRRMHPEPVVLHVDSAGAQAAGTSSYIGNELVWLAEHIPADF